MSDIPKLENPEQPGTLSRRSFLKLAAAGMSTAIIATTVSSPIPEAAAARQRDEPNAQITSTSEGVDNEGDPYTQYEIIFDEESFPVRVKTFPSDRYETLNYEFNPGNDPSTYKVKPVTTFTFNYGSVSEDDSATKVTLYALQSAVEDPSNPDGLFLLHDDFYISEPDPDHPGKIIKTLDIEYATRMFAQVFNPRAIGVTSKVNSLSTLNRLRAQSADQGIHNISVIGANKHGYDAPAIANFDLEGIPSDSGFNLGQSYWPGRNEAMDNGRIGTAHEVRHVRDIMQWNGNFYGLMEGAFGRDSLRETLAQTSEAAAAFALGQTAVATDAFERFDEWLVSTQGEFNFTPYTPSLFLIMVEPYLNEMCDVLNEANDVYDSDGQLTHAGLSKMNTMYLRLHDELFTKTTMGEYLAWRSGATTGEGRLSSRPVLTNQFDLLLPLYYAKAAAHGSLDLTTRESIASFMNSAIDEVEQKAMSLRIEALSQAFRNEQEGLKPYFQDKLNAVLRDSAGDFPEISNLNPGQTFRFSRPRDKDYINKPERFDLWDYRKYYPMYHMWEIPVISTGTHYVVEQVSENEEFLIVVRYPESSGLEVFSKNSPLKIDPAQRAVICMLDKRTGQIVEDQTGNVSEIFQITASPAQNIFMPQINNKGK